MSRRILGVLAVLAILALVGWLGFSDGREHRAADRAGSSPG